MIVTKLTLKGSAMQLTLEIPDHYLQGQNQIQTARQIKLYAALLMFQSGQLSRGAACEFADVDTYDFLLACKQHQINVMDMTVEAIEADVLRFQQRHSG
jgi:predicted HTH domain antitoxin